MPETLDLPPLHAPPDAGPPATRERLGKVGNLLSRRLESLVGSATLVVVLAVISAIPLLNLLSLGYLMEASARVARSGRLREGFIGLSEFATVGIAIAAGWFWLLPVRLVHSVWKDAEIIEAGSAKADQLRILLVVLTLLVGLHLVWACVRGGKLRYFLWPAPLRFLRWIGGEFDLAAAKRRLSSFSGSLRLGHYLRLGTLGFAGAAIWLALPVGTLFAASGLKTPGLAALTSLVGALLLGIAVLYLPFLQTRFAITGRFGEFFELRLARSRFRRAPLAHWLALSTALLFALPLYLLKIELTPSEMAWLPNLLFVVFIFPARLLLGWAVSRSERQETDRFWLSQWVARLAALPVAATYVFVVWLAQYLSWHGSFGLLEQHAFLVPAPLFGL